VCVRVLVWVCGSVCVLVTQQAGIVEIYVCLVA